MLQNLYFYIDDSGVLHKNDDYFVYAGYVFYNEKKRDSAYRRYKSLSNEIRKYLNISGELKSANLKPKHKRSLYNILKYEDSLAAYVYNKDVFDYIMENKKSRHRFKDYILKRIIKEKINEFIESGHVNPNNFLNIRIYIDEQLTASNGYYDLRSSIEEELLYGISNYDYNKFYPPILHGGANIHVKFVDSKNNYLIQASDILANRLRASFAYNKPYLRRKPNHCDLHFPKILVK